MHAARHGYCRLRLTREGAPVRPQRCELQSWAGPAVAVRTTLPEAAECQSAPELVLRLAAWAC